MAIIMLSDGPSTILPPTKKNYPEHKCNFSEDNGYGAYTCPICGKTILGY